jgi:hypothetical protein
LALLKIHSLALAATIGIAHSITLVAASRRPKFSDELISP